MTSDIHRTAAPEPARALARTRTLIAAALIVLDGPGTARAGMPMIALTDLARARLQSISFFLAGFLLAAWAVRRIWNSLRDDFPALPSLTFGKALGVVTLWGLLFLLVLTMISGARELMTPGAWTKQGFTYALAEGAASSPSNPEKGKDAERLRALDRLHIALWTYARDHGGRLPEKAPESIPDEAWRVPDPSGMRYLYAGGQAIGSGTAPVAFEPDIFEGPPLVLRADGSIAPMAPEAIRRAMTSGAMR